MSTIARAAVLILSTSAERTAGTRHGYDHIGPNPRAIVDKFVYSAAHLTFPNYKATRAARPKGAEG